MADSLDRRSETGIRDAGALSTTGARAWGQGRFPTLMPRRVEEILLVSSPYDSFALEEDGMLTELIYTEYTDLGLTHAPNVTHASTASEALTAIGDMRFDLVIAMSRLGDMPVDVFREKARSVAPNMPVALLVSGEHELQQLQQSRCPLETDSVYVWHGDAKLFVAIVKSIEDRWNAEHDTHAAGVGAIIVVEDSPQFRSALLPIMYSELVKQSRAVLAEGINRMHRRLRMRARPKILVADCYEVASEFYQRYRKFLFGVISDVAFPKGGAHDREAGFAFIRQVKYEEPDLPALLQSSDEDNRWQAQSLGASFLHKKSPTLLQDISGFMLSNFGFGDFVFRLPDGREVARVSDLRSMLRVLPRIPVESIEYHASRNHFSNWLRARTEFDLAAALRPRTVGDFPTIEGLRDYLMRSCREALRANRRGVIEDFSRERFDVSTHFARIGTGSLGGKARGLAFVDSLLARTSIERRYDNVMIHVPRSVVIGTDIFDEFLETNQLKAIAYGDAPDADIRTAFVAAHLPRRLVRALGAFLHIERTPVAVRSSSLLEDSEFHPFAGVYDTYMLPNNHRDSRTRLLHLADAIKLVYASNFYRATRRYIDNTPFHVEEQKMAVIIQPVIGRQHGDYFYPSLAGTARSINFYPQGSMQPQDGIASVGLGMGALVVEGGASLKFSPAHPQLLPQLGEPEEFINQSQRSFFAIDLRRGDVRPCDPAFRNTVELGLDLAEDHGTLAPVGSVWSPDNQALSDGIYRPGVRVVTFAHILKNELFPLAPILSDLLAVGRAGMNAPVDIEFAANLDTEPRQFTVLQIRPCALGMGDDDVSVSTINPDEVLAHSPQALGHGVIDGVCDIVYVKPTEFDANETVRIAEQIAVINDRLRQERRGALLIGAGRWGTSNRWLGIPVTWDQISAARILVEAALDGFVVDPSQGSHFFHNLTSFGVAYLSVNPGAEQGAIDWAWLETQPVVSETGFVRWVRTAEPVVAHINGKQQRAVIFKQPPRGE